MSEKINLLSGLLDSKSENPSKSFFKKLLPRKASLDARKARSGYLFVAPFILGVLLIYLPILIDSVWFSFSTFMPDPNNPGSLILTNVGFANYTNAMKNTGFVSALLAAAQKLILEVPAIIIFSLFIAVVLNQKMLGRAMFRAIFFLPVIVSTGIMESISMSTAGSTGNADQGIDDGSGGSSMDLISVLDVQILFANMKVGGGLVSYVIDIVNNVYSIINYSGVQMLIFLAGLQSISPSIYEACRIDGASGWETFWKVTFPMISPMILVNSIYTIIDSFIRTDNPVMVFMRVDGKDLPQSELIAMSMLYFVIVMLIIAVVAAIASSFVFYQRKD